MGWGGEQGNFGDLRVGGSRAILDWRLKGEGGAGQFWIQFWIGDLRVAGSRAILDWRFTGGEMQGNFGLGI